MNNSVWVSILIPSYNHELFIKRCLDSVLEDDYLNKEIIIIDDGSTDSSDELISKWIIENRTLIRVTYLRERNKGLCATLNQLISKSTSKYVLILASDDELFGNTLTERVALLEKEEPNSKYVLVSDAYVVNDQSEIVMQSSMSDYNKGDKKKYLTDEGILEEVILNPSISGAVLLLNRKIYELVGPYPEDLSAEDWYFYQRAAGLNSILFYNKKVSLYRIHGSNSSGEHTSNVKKIKLVRSIIKTFTRNISWFKEMKFKVMAIRQLSKFYFMLLKLYLRKMLNVN